MSPARRSAFLSDHGQGDDRTGELISASLHIKVQVMRTVGIWRAHISQHTSGQPTVFELDLIHQRLELGAKLRMHCSGLLEPEGKRYVTLVGVDASLPGSYE